MNTLAGDIGGTNIRLAIINNKLKILAKETYSSKNYKSLESAVAKFTETHQKKFKNACFGIPCPVEKGVCKTTNLPWKIDSKKLSKKLNCKVLLINDFEANCYGTLALDKKDLLTLNRGDPEKSGPVGIIGAGTGLGHGFIVEEGKKPIVISSEGGHCDFAAQTQDEKKLHSWLARKYKHVSWERVVSGPGITNIYEWISKSKKTPEEITEKALRGERKSKKALEIFSRAFGAQAGNAALILNTKKIYLSGGLAPKVFPKFKSKFLEGFSNKGRLSPIVKKTAVHVIKNQNLGLLGAKIAARHIK